MKYSISLTDQIFFSKKLSLLIDSNISMSESLRIIVEMDSSNKRKEIWKELLLDCTKGISLSKSLSNSNAKFDPLLISLIKSGEYSGSLVLALDQIYKNLEKRAELKSKIIGILIYPVFIFFTTIAMTIFLIMYIFPKILPLLSSLNIKLPLITRMVKMTYEIISNYWLYIIVIIFVTIVTTFISLKKSLYLRSFIDRLLISIPILKSYIKLRILSSVCGAGEMLLSSGISLPDFHLFAKSSVDNIFFKKAFDTLHKESIQGISFNQSIASSKDIFPKIMIEMCAVGERTGSLGVMLGHCAKIFEADIEDFLKRFSSLIEPALMISMGLVIGTIALSIILPIYEITNHLGK